MPWRARASAATSPTGPAPTTSTGAGKSVRGVGQQHLRRVVVGDAGGGEIFDLRIHAVAFTDAVAPRPRIEGLGVGPALPQIDAAGPAVLGVDELLADQAGHRAEAWRELAEGGGARPRCDSSRPTV